MIVPEAVCPSFGQLNGEKRRTDQSDRSSKVFPMDPVIGQLCLFGSRVGLAEVSVHVL